MIIIKIITMIIKKNSYDNNNSSNGNKITIFGKK